MQTLRVTSNTSRLTVLLLTASICMGVGVYMYLVAQSIVNAALAKETERDIASVATRVGKLEYSYLRAMETINADRARELGFAPVSEKYFASREATGGLSLLSTEN